ncbi:MAG: hypothetical protein GYA15_06460 [Leptolinea sp.]|jgi:hypothetical protein|nr:hypothetical protein [Leptolinea sp.]
MRRFFKDNWKTIYFLLLLINLFLGFYDFLPNLSEINGWDEAKYINQGRFLMEGRLPTFADNPFLSLFYGILYLPLIKSPFWLIQCCSLGRFVLFFLNWLATYLIARELEEFAHPLIMLGLFLISPLSTLLLNNPSDGLFAALSGLAFWQILRYFKSRQPRNLIICSTIIGLSALSRNDGVVLWAILLALVLFITGFNRQLTRILLYSAIPFIVLTGGYVLIYGSITGDYSLHIQERSYTAFEQGHELAFDSPGINSPTINAMLDSRATYGTGEENHYSPILAILRNPPAYFERLKIIVAGLPPKFLDVYNKKMAVLLLLLAIRGIWELVQQRKGRLLVLLLVWPAYLFTYFLTFFRTGYLRTPFFILFALAAIGLTALINHLEKRRETGLWSGALALAILFGIIDNKLAIFYGAGLFLIAIWFVYWLRKHFLDARRSAAVSLLLFLCVGLILRGNFASPRFHIPGSAPDEQAAKYMIDNFAPGTVVLAGGPGAVWEAKMEFASLVGTDIPDIQTGEQFIDWLNENNFQAIYLDFSISRDLPHFWDMIQEQDGKGLREVFSVDNGSIRIYLVNPV